MPRPSSTTVQLPSAWRTTRMFEQNPASASSTELSTTSKTRGWSPSDAVSPTFIAGRLREPPEEAPADIPIEFGEDVVQQQHRAFPMPAAGDEGHGEAERQREK